MNLPDYEVYSVISFERKNIRPAEILQQLVELYGEVVMNKEHVCK